MDAIARNIPLVYLLKTTKGFMLYMSVIVLFYQENALSLYQIMLLQSIYSLVVAILEVPSGYLSDVWGRKQTLFAGSICIFFQFMTLSLSSSFGGFALGLIFGGVGASFLSGTNSALLYDSLLYLGREKEYIKAEGQLYGLGTGAEAIAAIGGGTLAFYCGLRWPIYGQCLIALLGVGAAYFLTEPPTQLPEKASEQQYSTQQKIIRALSTDRSLVWLIVLGALCGCITLNIAWFAQPYLEENLHFSTYQIGIIWAILNGTVAVFSFNAYKFYKYTSRWRLAFIVLLMLGASGSMLQLGTSVHYSLGLTAFLLLYASRGIITPFFKDWINERVESSYRATILSIRSLGIRLFYVCTAPLLGRLADIYDTPTTFLVLGASFLLFAMSSLFFLKLSYTNKIRNNDA